MQHLTFFRTTKERGRKVFDGSLPKRYDVIEIEYCFVNRDDPSYTLPLHMGCIHAASMNVGRITHLKMRKKNKILMRKVPHVNVTRMVMWSQLIVIRSKLDSEGKATVVIIIFIILHQFSSTFENNLFAPRCFEIDETKYDNDPKAFQMFYHKYFGTWRSTCCGVNLGFNSEGGQTSRRWVKWILFTSPNWGKHPHMRSECCKYTHFGVVYIWWRW